MKKVGKEFKKTLSAILVAALVMTSMPETTLVARAEEAKTYEVNGEYAEVGAPDSKSVTPTYTVKLGDTELDAGKVSVEATVQTDENTTKEQWYIQKNITLTGTDADKYEVTGVEGARTVTGFDGYVIDAPAGSEPVIVTVKQVKYDVAFDFVDDAQTPNTVSAKVFYAATATKANATELTLKDGTARVPEGNGYLIFKTDKAIKSVTFGASETVKPEKIASANEAYKVNITSDSDTVKVVTAKEESSVKVEKGEGVAAVLYKANTTVVDSGAVAELAASLGEEEAAAVLGAAADGYIPVTGDTIKVAKDSNVSVRFIYADHYTYGKHTLKQDAAEKDYLTTDSAELDSSSNALYSDITVTTKGVTAPYIKVVGKKVENTIIFNAPAKINDKYPAMITIEPSGKIKEATTTDPGKKVDKTDTIYLGSESTTANNNLTNVTLTVEDGEEIAFTVKTAAGYKDVTVEIDGDPVSLNADNEYVVTSDRGTLDSANITVAVAGEELGNAIINTANAQTVVGKKDSTNVIATSRATSIQKMKWKDDEKKDVLVEDGSTVNIGTPISGVKEGTTDFKFKVNVDSGYAVDKVTWGTGDDPKKYTALTASEEGVYTIAEIPTEDITIEVTTKLDRESAKRATFDWSDRNIKSVKITAAEDSDTAHQYENAFPVKSGEEVFAATAITAVIEVNTGYELCVDGTKVPLTNHKYSLSAKGDGTAYNLTVEAEASETDKYVKIDLKNAKNADITLDAELVESKDTTTNKYAIYKISKDNAAPEFTVTVPYGSKLAATPFTVSTTTGGDATLAAINLPDKYTVSADKKTVTYTGAILTKALTVATKTEGTETVVDENNYDTFTLAGLVNDAPTIAISGNAKSVTVNGESASTTGNISAKLGDTVVIALASYQKLSLTDEEWKNAKEVSVDSYGEYTFTVEGDTYLKIEDNKEASDYVITVTAKDEDQVSLNGNDVVQVPHTTNTYKLGLKAASANVAVAFDTGKGTNKSFKVKNVALSGASKSTVAIGENKTSADLKISSEDAGATMKLDFTLEIKDTKTGRITEDSCTATIIMKSKLTGVSLADIANGDTLKLEAGESKKSELSLLSAAFAEENPVNDVDDLKAIIDVKTAVEKGTPKTTAVLGIKNDNGKVVPTITITAGTEAEDVTVSILDKSKDKDNAIFTFKVSVAASAVSLKSVQVPAQGSNSVLVALTPSKTKINALNEAETEATNVYYEILVKTAGTAPTGSINNKAYYIPVEVDDEGYAKAGSYEITLNTAKPEAAAGDYELTSRIVTLKSAKNIARNPYKAETAVSESGILAASKAIATKVSTKNVYFEDNLKVKKIDYTVVNTDQDKEVASVVYSKNASDANFESLGVTVFNADGSTNYTIAGNVDNTGKVLITANNAIPGKYTVQVASKGNFGTLKDPLANTLIQSKVTFNITVVQGIKRITVNNSSVLKIKLNTKKDTTYTLKPALYGAEYQVNGAWKYYAPKKSTLKYEIVKDSMQPANKNNVKVDAKTGKITVSKNFVLGTNKTKNTFEVKITANDCAKTTTTRTVRFEVTNEAVALGSVKLQKFNTENQKYADVTGDVKMTETGFAPVDKDGDGYYNDYRYLKLSVLDAAGNDATGLVTYKSSSSSVAIDAKTGVITVKKPAKNVVFTVTTTDGGKKSVKSVKYNFVYAKAGSLGIIFTENDAETTTNKYNQLIEKKADYYEYTGTVNSRFRYNVVDFSDVANKISTFAPTNSYSYKLSIKGGKFVRPANYSIASGYVVPTAETTVITLTDNTNKTKRTITLKNTAYPTAKAPRAKLVDGKVFVNDTNELTYTVKGDYKYVYITNETDKYSYLKAGTVVPVKIENGQFKVEITGDKAGTDKYMAVYGDITEDGTFIPATKAAYINVKVNKMANFKPQTKYVYNAKVANYITFTGTPANAIDSNAVGVQGVYSANIKGKANKFADYFTVDGADHNEINATAELAKAIEKNTLAAEDLTGYVTYKYYNAKGVIATKDVKITVAIESGDGTFAVEKASILNIKDSTDTVAFELNGNVAVLKNVVSVVTKDWAVEAAKDDDGAYTLLQVKAGKAFEPGEYTIEAYVVPLGAAAASKVTTASDAKKYGTLITIPVVVNNAAEYATKVSTTDKIVELNDKTTVKTKDSKKTAYWTVDVQDTELVKYEMENGVYAIKSAESVGSAIEVSYDAGSKKFTFNVYKDTVEAGTVYYVDVKLGFGTNVAEETVRFLIKTPDEIQTMADVKAEIEKFLTTKTQWDSPAATGVTVVSSESSVKNAIDNANIVKKISLVDVTAKDWKSEGTGDSTTKTVTIELTDRYDTTVKDSLTVEIPKTVEGSFDSEQAVLDEIKKYADLIVSEEADLNGKTDAQKAEALIVSSSTTRFDIRAQLEKGLKNDKYMLSITSFTRTAATDKKNGSISFSYRLVTKDTQGTIVTPPAPVVIKAGN